MILGYRIEQLESANLADVIRPLDPAVSVESLMLDGDSDGERGHRPGGDRRGPGRWHPPGARHPDGAPPARRRTWSASRASSGIETADRDLEADKNEFLAMVTNDLRQPLTAILGLGATIESHIGELTPPRMGRMGGAIRRQAERIARLADDLYDVSRLEAHAVLLTPRAGGARRGR